MKKIALCIAIVAAAAVGAAVRPTAQAGSAASAYFPAGPERVLDTRTGDPVTGGNAPEIDTGLVNASAVAVNITIIDPAGTGYVTAFSTGAVPEASILNVDAPGQTETNFVIVPVVSGRFRLFTSTDAHLIVDLMGYFENTDSGPTGP